MEFINNQLVKDDLKNIETARNLMSKLAGEIVTSGLNISASELYQIATGRLSLTKIYQSEAEHRTEGSPQYVVEEALSLASNQANKSQETVNSLRKFGAVLSKLPEKNFKMTEECEVLYTSDLTKDLTAIHTRKLSEKQEQLYSSVEKFQKSLENFNNLLVEAGQSKIKMSIPFLTVQGQPDLSQILTINYESLEDQKKRAIQAGIQQKTAKEMQRKRLEKLISEDYPDREATILHYLTIDPEGKKYSDEVIKNLLFPDKGSFKDARKAQPIGSIYEDGRPVR